MVIKSAASWLQSLPTALEENHTAISQRRTIQDILIFYSMLPLPFPISFSLSFVTPWVSSLPYLPWMGVGEARVRIRYHPDIFLSILAGPLSDRAYSCYNKGFPLSPRSHLTALFWYYLASKFNAAVRSAWIVFLYFFGQVILCLKWVKAKIIASSVNVLGWKWTQDAAVFFQITSIKAKDRLFFVVAFLFKVPSLGSRRFSFVVKFFISKLHWSFKEHWSDLSQFLVDSIDGQISGFVVVAVDAPASLLGMLLRHRAAISADMWVPTDRW